MHHTLLYVAYGWLTLGGALQFLIDVVSQHFHEKHTPGPETTLYYGLHSSFALGQVAFGLVCLWLAWTAPDILDDRPIVALSMVAALGWTTIAFSSITYWEPKIAAILFAILVIAAWLTK